MCDPKPSKKHASNNDFRLLLKIIEHEMDKLPTMWS